MMKVNCSTRLAVKFSAMRPVAMMEETTRPTTGTSRFDIFSKTLGKSPSWAAALAHWPWRRIHPFRAPKAEMAAPSAMSLPAHVPQIRRPASANGAVDTARSEAGTIPITPTVARM